VYRKPKILVIRFSSIGDIILTTPLIRCLKHQIDAEIDFLTKSNYQDLIISNPNISEVITFSTFPKTIDVLKSKKYDFVIDLQNNFRSLRIRSLLTVKSYTFSKNNFRRYILIYFGINLLNNHIVDRYFKSVEELNISNDNQGIDYFISNKNLKIDFNTDQEYICWCIGGTYEQKKLSVMQITNVISKIELPILFIGGESEKKISSQIINSMKCNNVSDLCGKTSIDESAYLIKKSKLVLTNDTGMMHIASAFDIPIISFWGCTKPSLGFSPYQANVKSETIITELSGRPCSKHGKYCRFQSDGCIKEIDEDIIINTVTRLLK
jgi:ADP-heptose:LPS heptosyltransferase